MPSRLLAATTLLSATLLPAQTQPAILPLDQIHTQPELEQTIRALDTQLFSAYNHCADPDYLSQFAAFFTPDIEFYHDQGGSTFGIAPFAAAIKANICGKVTRQLVPSSLRVYPMKNLGAIEFGTHRFFHPTDASHGSVPQGEADFVHLWVYKDGAWRISRVLSYDHRSAPAL